MKSKELLNAVLFGVLCCIVSAMPAIGQTSVASSPPSTLQQTAIDNETKLIAAKKKDDALYFKRILAENFTLVTVDGALHEKQEALDELGDSGLLELTPYDIRVVAVSDNAAIVTYDAILRKAPEEDQGPPPRYQHFSSVWVKQNDQWKLTFHQATAKHWGDW